MPAPAIQLPPRRVTPELVHVAALLMLRDGAKTVAVHFESSAEVDYRVGCGGRCDLVRDFDPGRNVHFAPFAALCGQGLGAHGAPAGLVGAAWAALGPQILSFDGIGTSVLAQAYELLFAPIDRRAPAPTLEPLLPGLRQLNWIADPEAVALAIQYTASTITAMLAELVRRENTLAVEADDLWQAYIDAVHTLNDDVLARVMVLDAPSSAARIFLKRHDPQKHVLLVIAPATIAASRYRVIAAVGAGNRPIAPLKIPPQVVPVRRHRPGYAELATREDAQAVARATLKAYYHPKNYLTRLRSLF